MIQARVTCFVSAHDSVRSEYSNRSAASRVCPPFVWKKLQNLVF